MAQLQSLEDALVESLKDLYSAENQLLKALPKMAKRVANESLKDAIKTHLEETQGQVKRLNEISKILDQKLTGKRCKAMQGLIEEGKEVMEEKSENDSLIDALLIGAAQRVEHYEIAAYGTARAIAEKLGRDDIAELLQETLDEEGEADRKLTAISEEEVLQEALDGAELEVDDEDPPLIAKAKKSNGHKRGQNGQKRRSGMHASPRKSRR